MTVMLGLFLGLSLAYVNGANDNFKGVATLWGSGRVSYGKALLWATLCTGLGSLAALWLSQGLLHSFSGKGLLPDALLAANGFPLALGLGAGLTVAIATWFGLPVSTTHALMGGLVGAGLAASPQEVNFSVLGKGFLLPLVLSPFLSAALTSMTYGALQAVRTWTGIQEESCLCIHPEPVLSISSGALAMSSVPSLRLELGKDCPLQDEAGTWKFDTAILMDLLHYLSAGLVSFARGLNDTPKLVALLLLAAPLSSQAAFWGVGLVMAMGALFNARKVAGTLSHRVTAMNAGEGFTANLVTGLLVVLASTLAFPVSTTHVSCGSLFGLGAVNGKGQVRTISGILTAWLLTLPLAAMLSAAAFLASNKMLGYYR